MKIRYLLAVIVLVAFTLPLFGQTAQLTGRVSDPSAAVIPGAQVHISNEATGVSRTVTSDEAGYFTVPLLDPGTYQVIVNVAGFKQSTRRGIVLAVNQSARIDFVLEVGQRTEVVTVTGAAPVVEKETGSLGTVMDRASIASLPLNQRNPYLLVLLVPGVLQKNDATDSGDAAGYSKTSHFMVNGGRVQSNEFLLDGTSNTASWSGPTNSVPALPPVDAVQEFKAETNSYSAEFGRSSGGVISMVMRSGTNKFHGSAHEYLRNSVLDANTFFANKAGRPLGAFKRNMFGGTFGGPILHDKAFFFASYEGLRARTNSNFTATVPTPLERAGDFSATAQTVSGRCTPVVIYDPATTRANPNATGWVRDPFPGNKIPSYRFDKVGVNILGLYPLPNTTGNACSNASNFFVSNVLGQTTDQFDSRFDYVPNEKNRFNGGLNWRRDWTAQPNNYRTLASTTWQPYNDPSEGARLTYTRIQAANFLINARLGVSRALRRIPAKENINLTELGFPQSLQNQMTHPLDIPFVQPSGYGNIGHNCCPFAFLAGTTYSSNLNASWVHGRHTIKFGGDIRFLQSYELTGFFTSGQYAFGRDFTQGPNPLVASAIAGNGAASLLLGTGNGSVPVIPPVLTSSRYYALFFQDNVRVTDKLVVNLGLRYDVATGRSERYNSLSWFDFNTPSPLAQKVPAFSNLRGGLRFVGGDTKRQFDTEKNNFGPRFGLAYTINRKTVLRSGYGILYPPFTGGVSGATAGFAGFQVSTTWVSSLDGITPLNYLANAFPKGLNMPTGSALGLLTSVGEALGSTGRDGVVNRKTTTGYMQQWNLNLQRELPGSITLEAAYVGSKGTKLSYGPLDLNQLAPQYLQLGLALNQLVANPFYGFIPGSGPLTQPKVMQGQLLRPYPQFLNLLALNLDAASSVYHAFQLRAQKQFAQGLTFMLSYSAAKLINDSENMDTGWGPHQTQNTYDRRSDRGLSALDQSQRLVINYVYTLPVGRGKRLGSSWSPWLDRAIGGWQFNGVTVFSKGTPLSITAVNTSGAYNSVERSNVNGNNPKLPGGRTTDARLAKWFDTSVFSQPAPFTFGNGPRTLPNIRVDGRKNFDMSLFKSFAIREQARVEFRAELFNAFNTPRFGSPNLVIGNASFGIVSGQANKPRQAQLALKFMF
jgi:hypothetical protein